MDLTDVSARAPFLEYSEYYFESLQKNNVSVDSSVFVGYPIGSPRFWPYTLDFGFPRDYFC